MLRALWLPFLPARLITGTKVFDSSLPPLLPAHKGMQAGEAQKEDTLFPCHNSEQGLSLGNDSLLRFHLY